MFLRWKPWAYECCSTNAKYRRSDQRVFLADAMTRTFFVSDNIEKAALQDP